MKARILALLVFSVMVPPASPEAQCLTGLAEIPFDTSSNCASQPSIDRIFGSQVIRWKNHDYLFSNIGNEVKLWRIDVPDSPLSIDESRFNVGNVGDSDYDLYNFSVCDECRWGIANYKRGTVLFDLGAGTTPRFAASRLYTSANIVPGAFTFSRESKQYVIAATMVNGCGTGASTLYEFAGIDDVNLSRISCVEADSVAVTMIVGGESVGDYLYLGDRTTRVFLYHVVDAGTSIRLDYVSTPMFAYMIKDSGLGFDELNHVVIEAGSSGFKVWDISDPGDPVLRSSVAGDFNRAALSFPLVFVAKKGFKHSEETWDISNRDAPEQVDADFWSAANPFNDTAHQCNEIQGGIFSPDGTVLYLSRYSRLQLADVLACMGPVPPAPDFDVTPSPAFPGDTVTIENLSRGTVDRKALWVTDGPDPIDTLVVGSTTLSAGTPDTLLLPIDLDLTSNQIFWAHVAVESDEFPYTPGVTTDQILSRLVSINRSPLALISVAPDMPMTGESVMLTAIAEGHPSHPSGGQAYQWLISPPLSAAYTVYGLSTGLTLSESGVWNIGLDIYYEHENVLGGDFVGEVSDEIDAFSIVADFVYSPANPQVSAAIVLDASVSRLAPGAAPSYSWTISGPATYAGCPSGEGAELCTIPAGSLLEGLYDFQLTLSNTNNTDVSTRLIEDIFVDDLSMDFVWSPSIPEVGEFVEFRVHGLDEADFAVWDFGEDGCDGIPQVYYCEPLYTDCLVAGFRFSSAGNKSVSLTVVTGGVTVGPVKNDVEVTEGTPCEVGEQTDQWQMMEGRGFSFPNNTSAASMAGFGEYIYAGTENPSDGFEIWRSSTGHGWAQVASGGLGNSLNTAVPAMQAFDGMIFVGTSNAAGAELWFSDDGMIWQSAVNGGFDDSNNRSITALAADAGGLYASTAKSLGGAEIWFSDDGFSWSQINTDGFGQAGNNPTTLLGLFDNKLYAATSNSSSEARLWRWISGTQWQQVGGDGFGDSDNLSFTAIAELGSHLYISTQNINTGAEIWRSEDGTTWQRVMADGFGAGSTLSQVSTLVGDGSELYAGAAGTSIHRGVWRSEDGLTWVQSAIDGFGADDNGPSPTSARYQSSVFFGTENINGLQIWRLGDDSIFNDSFESGDTSMWN